MLNGVPFQRWGDVCPAFAGIVNVLMSLVIRAFVLLFAQAIELGDTCPVMKVVAQDALLSLSDATENEWEDRGFPSDPVRYSDPLPAGKKKIVKLSATTRFSLCIVYWSAMAVTCNKCVFDFMGGSGCVSYVGEV